MGMSPMADLAGCSTVVTVSLRSAIRDLLTGGDPTALGDVPADEVAQALTNYADTASLAEADALAPVVTRASHVPFDEELDGNLGAPLVDVHAELATLDPVDVVDTGAESIDPGDSFDDASGNATAAEGNHEVEVDVDDGLGDDGLIDDEADDDGGNAESNPDGWFESDTDVRPVDESDADAPGLPATVGDDAMAFGSGELASTLDVVSTPDVGLMGTDVASGEEFEPFQEFSDSGIEPDAINELPADSSELDLGLAESSIDDGAIDDSFGDVDFDV